jgi:hypothetical protein
MTTTASLLYSPNAYSGLAVVPYHERSTEIFHPLHSLVLRDTDHHLLPVLAGECKNTDLLLKDAHLSLRQIGHHGHLNEGSIVFSPDRKKMTTHTHQIHRRGRAILFPDGARFPLAECWTLTLQQNITHLRKTYQRLAVPATATGITRPDRQCSVCLEDLNGNLATCPNQHQVHQACYNGLSAVRRACPECRTQYSPDEVNRLTDTPDRLLLHTRLVYPNETRPNADRRFCGLLKRVYSGCSQNTFAFLDTMDYWVRQPKTDYLLDESNGEPFYNGFERPAWRQLITYFLSQENRDRLKTRALTPNAYNATYGEPEFFADLLRLHPTNATETLEAVRSEEERLALRRACWVQYRLSDPTIETHNILRRYMDKPNLFCVRTQGEEVIEE